MRRALVPLLTAAALHCGDATTSDSAGASATTAEPATTTTFFITATPSP